MSGIPPPGSRNVPLDDTPLPDARSTTNVRRPTVVGAWNVKFSIISSPLSDRPDPSHTVPAVHVRPVTKVGRVFTRRHGVMKRKSRDMGRGQYVILGQCPVLRTTANVPDCTARCLLPRHDPLLEQ